MLPRANDFFGPVTDDSETRGSGLGAADLPGDATLPLSRFALAHAHGKRLAAHPGDARFLLDALV